MRFSAISSRVKSCVSISTFEGSFEAARRDGRSGVWEVLQRKGLLRDFQSEALVLGIDAGFRVAARSLSTAALTR
jgi:hypothetical protein